MRQEEIWFGPRPWVAIAFYILWVLTLLPRGRLFGVNILYMDVGYLVLLLGRHWVELPQQIKSATVPLVLCTVQILLSAVYGSPVRASQIAVQAAFVFTVQACVHGALLEGSRTRAHFVASYIVFTVVVALVETLDFFGIEAVTNMLGAEQTGSRGVTIGGSVTTSLSFAAALYFQVEGGRLRNLAIPVVVACNAWVALMTASRTGIVLCATLPLAGVIVTSRVSRRVLVSAIAVAVLLIVAFYWLNEAYPEVFGRVASRAERGGFSRDFETADSIRMAEIKRAWDEMNTTFPWGRGLGGTDVAGEYERRARVPHLWVMQLVQESGIAGLLLFFWMTCSPIIRVKRVAKAGYRGAGIFLGLVWLHMATISFTQPISFSRQYIMGHAVLFAGLRRLQKRGPDAANVDSGGTRVAPAE